VKKQILTILVLLFSIIIKDQAGNNFFAGVAAKGAFFNTESDTINPNNPTLYSPKDVGMNPVELARIDAIVKEGIKARVFPGCQVLVLKEGKPVYDKCFGNYTYDAPQKVQPTTMYDLASLSKTTGTLLAIMKLYDDGKLKLTDKASNYLNFLRGTDKENITIKELLFHESGLPAYLPIYWLAVEKKSTPILLASTKMTAQSVKTDTNRISGTSFCYKEGWVSNIPSVEYPYQASDNLYITNRFHDAAMQKIADTKLYSKTYRYSCLNFILLKEIVEKISGMYMDVILNNEFFSPMKLNNIAYKPLLTHKKEEIAPTLKKDVLRQGEIQGYVNDLDAAFLGGVSGNAGLFASAENVATVYQMLLNNGEFDGKRYLSAETCRLFTTTTSASGRRSLGFDKPVPGNPKQSPCCISAPRVVYGHTGYTGTCCWVDPVNRLVYVFLSNRTYPNDGVNKLAKTGIRTKIQEVIYQSIKNRN
jgi:CubicO group peptidase (beta-lactamase class C family)